MLLAVDPPEGSSLPGLQGSISLNDFITGILPPDEDRGPDVSHYSHLKVLAEIRTESTITASNTTSALGSHSPEIQSFCTRSTT